MHNTGSPPCTPRLIGLAALLAMVVSALFATAAQAQQAHREATGPDEILDYWTPHRLRDARPAEVPAPRTLPNLRRQGAPKGEPTATRGSDPTIALPRDESGPRRPAGRLHSAWAGLELPWSIQSYGYVSPTPAVGRLFFTKPGGARAVCSGVVVDINIVLTAAHCVRSGKSGRWNGKWVFAPGGEGTNVAPYGMFASRTATVKSTWSKAPWNKTTGTSGGGYFPMDYAFIVLSPDQRGWNVANYTGFFPILMNAPKSTIYHVGYPSAGQWAACTITSCSPWQCTAPFQRLIRYPGGKQEVGMSCFTSGGASGGPMLEYWNNAWYVVSVLSHMGVARRDANGGRYGTSFYGPYLDAGTGQLLEYTRRL